MKTLLQLAGIALIGLLSHTQALAAPKIAVTDLTYEERVREYFRVVSAQSKSSERASYSERQNERDTPYSYNYSGSSRGSYSGKSESSYYEAEGTYSYVDRGELHKFTADLKGALLRSRQFQVVQGKPYGTKSLENINNIIARIKRGDFKGADYVLFGSVSNMEFRNEAMPIAGSNNTSYMLSLELVADFNLINTRTYEVKAAFSAMGEGQDTKMVGTRGGVIHLNRGKVVSEVSKSLAEDAFRQIEEQFLGIYRPADSGEDPRTVPAANAVDTRENVIIYR
ncbi:MAG TPA: penicillin-binding protein activator LpoB [bacterium]|nr:penicillin-binding protein activator LpoB [bacterium]